MSQLLTSIKYKVSNISKKVDLIILGLALWQFFSVLMISAFNWPEEIIWLNLILLSLFIIFFDVFDSLILLIVSIPFFVVLPNQYFETLSMWRVLFALLFVVWFVKDKRLKIKDIKFLSWDKLLGLFVILAIVVTLIFAKFIVPGLKQILFWINVYIFYLVLVNTIKHRYQIIKMVKATAVSLLIIVVLGFVQLFVTFFTSLDNFWVYWASFVSKLYYGSNFAEVSLYSNSWFSYDGARQLRMFSIMPDSHSFALISVLAISFLLPLIYLFQKNKKAVRAMWRNIVLSGFAVALSATRSVWVGILGPIFSISVLIYKKIQVKHLKKTLAAFLLIIIFAGALPFVNQAFQFVKTGNLEGDFNSRVIGIYNLDGASNLGRIQIWKESLGIAVTNPFGVGLGNFAAAIYDGGDGSNYNQITSTIDKQFNIPYEFVTAHSLYLQILVELGFISLIIFVIFILKYFKDSWKFIKKYKEKNDFLIILVIQLSLALCWIFVSALFDVTLMNDKILIYFFISLGLSGVVINNYENLIE